MSELLSASEIQQRSQQLSAWQCDEKQLVQTRKFRDFVVAIRFVNRVAEIAEAMNHHPDIDIRWNQVRLVISTHSKGGLTEADFALAQKLDQITDENDAN